MTTNLVLVLIAIGVYLILAVVVGIALQLRGPRRLGRPNPGAGKHIIHGRGIQSAGSAVWEWREGRWLRVSDDLPAGVDAGPPPGYPGEFEGQTVRGWVRSW